MELITRRQALGTLALIVGAWPLAAQRGYSMQVYKDPSCGCCDKWVEHLRAAGFVVKVSEIADMTAVKDTYNVPKPARSCHTGIVNSLVMEGHVPATDIQRFLKARPPGAIGLAVPGMPIGSPGMEIASGSIQRYEVLAFTKAGRTSVFAVHGQKV